MEENVPENKISNVLNDAQGTLADFPGGQRGKKALERMCGDGAIFVPFTMSEYGRGKTPEETASWIQGKVLESEPDAETDGGRIFPICIMKNIGENDEVQHITLPIRREAPYKGVAKRPDVGDDALDKIIVKDNRRMAQIIQWVQSNAWNLPQEGLMPVFESGLIDFQEESMQLRFDMISGGVWMLELRLCAKVPKTGFPSAGQRKYSPAFSFLYDSDTSSILGPTKFPVFLSPDKAAVVKREVAKDALDFKTAYKFYCLTAFAACYAEEIEVDTAQETKRTKHDAKVLRRNRQSRLSLTRKVYVLKDTDLDTLNKYGEKEALEDLKEQTSQEEGAEKRAYTEPEFQVSVKGYYRTMKKSGKRVWVKGHSRYKNKPQRETGREYLV